MVGGGGDRRRLWWEEAVSLKVVRGIYSLALSYYFITAKLKNLGSLRRMFIAVTDEEQPNHRHFIRDTEKGY
jgi:hypothetical protein